MATEIYNPSVEIATLPYPLTGALKGGQRIVLSQSVSTLTSASPSLSGPFRVRDIGSYTGSVDDASYGLAFSKFFFLLTFAAAHTALGKISSIFLYLPRFFPSFSLS
jgi:hypothetical protein